MMNLNHGCNTIESLPHARTSMLLARACSCFIKLSICGQMRG